jgi:hypothetical protein
MTDTREELLSIAIFPYLKTSGPVWFGPYKFRSTDDLDGLSEAQATTVTEVTKMLYTQNNARVRSASYAVIPQIHVSGIFQIPEVLKRVHRQNLRSMAPVLDLQVAENQPSCQLAPLSKVAIENPATSGQRLAVRERTDPKESGQLNEVAA